MGRIVVGIDGSAHSRAALRWAVAQAARTGATVEAIMAWAAAPYMGDPWTGPMAIDLGEIEKGRQRELDEIVGSVDASGLSTPIEAALVMASPARALLESAKGAELLVVGTRGHGGFAGLLLGSVSHQCVSHAPCPVVVVPEPDADD